MRVLLRDRNTGLYYGGNDRWVPTGLDALDLQEPKAASALQHDQELTEAEIVLDSGSTGLRRLYNARIRVQKCKQIEHYRGSFPAGSVSASPASAK